MSRAFFVFQFLCKLPCYFGDLGNIYLQLPIKLFFCCICFLFMLFLIFIRLLYLCFLVISSLFDFTTSIRVITFIFFCFIFCLFSFCYWLFNLQNSRKVFLFSRFLLKLLWLEQMFATAFNPGLTRMWERVVRITSKTDLSAFSCLLFYSL